MGIIILPFLCVALGIALFALIKTIRLLWRKEIGLKEIAIGLAISVVLFGLICISYLMEGRASGLSPAFRIPMFMVFVPFIVYSSTKTNQDKTLRHLATLLLVSIGLTGVLGIIFNDVLFDLIDILGIERYY